MDNPGLPPELWEVLDGRLWHATAPEHLPGIVTDREIRVSTASRFKNSFCRCHDAVSLLDLGPGALDYPPQFGSWFDWFGDQQGTRVAIWLEVRRNIVDKNLLDADTALSEWKLDCSQRFIPGVEACHRGAVALEAIVDCVAIDDYDRTRFWRFGERWFEDLEAIRAFADGLPEPPPRSATVAAVIEQ